MKILYFTQLFYPALFGGGEFLFYQWAEELAKKGHQVFVVTQRLQNTKDFEIFNKIKIFRVGSAPKLSGMLPVGIIPNLSFLISSFFKGLEIARKEKVDLIHSNTYLPVFSGQWCSRILRIPHLVTVHDVYFTTQKDYWKKWSEQIEVSKVTKWIGQIIEKQIAKASVTAFHTVSETSKSDLEELGVKKKIVVIPNGINVKKFEMTSFQQKKQAVYIGRLVFYKNIETIINAFKKVVEKFPDANLVIVGDGPQKNELKKKIKETGLEKNIRLTGIVSEEEKIKLIHESIVLLHPSLIEGFGIVVIEGFACGTPVIVADVEPLSDLVDDSKDGFIVSPYDSKKWAAKIIELISNPSIAKTMGEVGKNKTISKYSIHKLTENLFELYLSLQKSKN